MKAVIYADFPWRNKTKRVLKVESVWNMPSITISRLLESILTEHNQ